MDSSSPADSPQQILAYAPPSASPVVTIWCRLFALWLLVTGIEKLVTIAGYYLVQQLSGVRVGADRWALAAIEVGIWPVMALYCWHEAPHLAIRLSNRLPMERVRPLRLQSLLRLALLAIGVYQISEALPYLAQHIISMPGPLRSLASLPWATMTTSLVRLGIGCLMVFGNAKAATFLESRFGPPGGA